MASWGQRNTPHVEVLLESVSWVISGDGEGDHVVVIWSKFWADWKSQKIGASLLEII